ncbi:MAG: Hsp70 family protein, partial [Gammaproteobacteria bacterium]|nr:Hsp70 family protein [Gammaproteobacteria bacterium]
RVTFQVDADGLLSVSAREEASGVESHIEVKPSYGLSDDEIAHMLRDSLDHAQDDMDARNLREQQVAADRVCEAVEAALAEDGAELLNPEELAAIEQAITVVQQAKNGSDFMAIKKTIKALNDASAEFAARRMNASISKALSGHRIEEID